MQPEIIFKHGQCSAAVFVNEFQRGEQKFHTRTVSFQRRYRDKSGEWKSTSNLGINDIPKAVLVLNKAYEFMTCNGADLDDKEPSQGVGTAREEVDGKVLEQQKKAIVNLLKKLGVSEDQIEAAIKKRYGLSLDDLDYAQRASIIQKLSAEVSKQ